MNQVDVRCWPHLLIGVHAQSSVTLWLTDSEAHFGHRLISCLNCGEVYAVDVSREMYGERSIDDLLGETCCLGCGEVLEDHIAAYPDQYFFEG
jgi:hypothetical protein